MEKTPPATDTNLLQVLETSEMIGNRERDALIAQRAAELNQVMLVIGALVEQTIEPKKYFH